MNKQRRASILALRGELDTILARVEDIGNELTELADAEQEAIDNLPEALQETERANIARGVVDALSSAASACDDGNVGEAKDELGGIEL